MYSELRNIAGNPVSIFLFKFVVTGNKIEFVLNEQIHYDMYSDLEEKIIPLVKASSETLLRYRHLSVSDTIMDCNILTTGECEVMLSKGLGKYFPIEEKENLFNDADKLQKILGQVMERRTLEEKQGITHQPNKRKEKNLNNLELAETELAKEKVLERELLSLIEGPPKAKNGKLKLEKLPEGVSLKPGYDHRGHCYEFSHEVYGYLGKAVLSDYYDGQTLIQSDLGTGDNLEERKKILIETVNIIQRMIETNFGR
jgi:hypothetical protein